jgi:hypothetical protein
MEDMLASVEPVERGRRVWHEYMAESVGVKDAKPDARPRLRLLFSANLAVDDNRMPGSARMCKTEAPGVFGEAPTISLRVFCRALAPEVQARTSCRLAGIFSMNCSISPDPEIGLPFQTMRELGVYRLLSVLRSLSHAV